MNNKFLQALYAQKKKTEQHNPLIAGSLGITINGEAVVEVADRPSYVYVQVRSSTAEVIEAFNQTVAPVYGLPIFIQWQGNRYVVVERDTMRYSQWLDSSAFLPRHASTHEFSGSAGDVVFVSQNQFLPLMPMPSGTLGNGSIAVNDYSLMTITGTFQYFPAQATANLTVWNPTSPTGAWMVLVSLDGLTGNLQYTVNSGTVFYNGITGTAEVLPYVPAVSDIGRYIPLAAVRLIQGTTRILWDNIYDVRPIYGASRTVSAGGGGGGGGTASVSGTGPLVFDEGIMLGTGTQFNFVGAGVTATISGTNIRVNIPGGGGAGGTGFLALDGSNSPVYGPVLFQNDAGGFGAGFHKEPIYIFASGSFMGMQIEKRWVPPSSNYQAGLYVANYDTRDETAFFYRRKVGDINPTVSISEDESHTGSPITFNPVLYVTRFNFSSRGNYTVPAVMVHLNNNVDSGGGFGIEDSSFTYRWRVNPTHTGTPFTVSYPFAGTTVAPYFSDTRNTLPTGSALQVWNHAGQTEYWMTKDGRFALNQVMVRERPTGGGSATHPTGSFSMGVVTLNAGTATARSTAVTDASRIFLTIQNGSGTNIGFPYVVDRAAGSGFTIMSSNLSDNSQVAWWVIEPV